MFSALAVDESALGYGLRYVRYSLIGGWIGGLAPLLFIRLGLATPRRVTEQMEREIYA